MCILKAMYIDNVCRNSLLQQRMDLCIMEKKAERLLVNCSSMLVAMKYNKYLMETLKIRTFIVTNYNRHFFLFFINI